MAGIAPVAVGWYRLAVAAVAPPAWRAARRLQVGRADLPRVLAVGSGLAGYQVCYFTAVDRIGVSVATLVTLGLAPVLVTAATCDRGPVPALPGGARRAGAGHRGSDIADRVPTSRRQRCRGRRGVRHGIGCRVRRRDADQSGPRTPSRTAGPDDGWLRRRRRGARAGGGVVGFGVPGSATALGLLLYVGVAPTAVAYALFFAGLRAVPATTAAVATLLEPLTAALLAGVVLGERLAVIGAIGGLCLCAAVAPSARD